MCKKAHGIPEIYGRYFEAAFHEEFLLDVPFTRESWHGRMKTCRGAGASLSKEETARWEGEHKTLLEQIAPERFPVRHYAALAALRKKPGARG